MKLRHRRSTDDSLHINLTPLIDTVFLLLIFFMMTTTFNRESQLSVNLPEATSKPITLTPETPIRIIIDANGEFAINDSDHGLVDTKLETLERALKDSVGSQIEPPLLISADANAPHHAVMTAMEAARNLGYVKLSFETQQRPESVKP